jgi:hypothetical protein
VLARFGRRSISNNEFQDICLTTLFSETWLCPFCAGEICGDCFSDLKHGNPLPGIPKCSKSKRKHRASTFVPFSHFNRAELDSAIGDMQLVLSETPSCAPPKNIAPSSTYLYTAELPPLPTTTQDSCYLCAASHRTRLLPSQANNLDELADLWRQGDSFVVDGITFRLPWTPEWFIASYGTQPCTILHCQTLHEKQTDVASFFGLFGKGNTTNGPWKLKVSHDS